MCYQIKEHARSSSLFVVTTAQQLVIERMNKTATFKDVRQLASQKILHGDDNRVIYKCLQLCLFNSCSKELAGS